MKDDCGHERLVVMMMVMMIVIIIIITVKSTSVLWQTFEPPWAEVQFSRMLVRLAGQNSLLYEN